MEAEHNRIQQAIGYQFSRAELLVEALTHRSFANEHPRASDNERLEFMGDAVLGLIVSTYLMEACATAREGELSRRRARLVNEGSLAHVARGLKLGPALRLGKGEQTTGGADKTSLLGDAVEALVGAVYLDGGLEAATQVVHQIYAGEIEQVAAEAAPRDYKSELNELVQRQEHASPCYEVEEERGPDHQKRFVVSARLAHRPDLETHGEGSSKKQAEQSAAEAMLRMLAETERPADEGEC